MNTVVLLAIGLVIGIVAGAGGVWVCFCLPKRTATFSVHPAKNDSCQKDKTEHNCTSCQGHSKC